MSQNFYFFPFNLGHRNSLPPKQNCICVEGTIVILVTKEMAEMRPNLYHQSTLFLSSY